MLSQQIIPAQIPIGKRYDERKMLLDRQFRQRADWSKIKPAVLSYLWTQLTTPSGQKIDPANKQSNEQILSSHFVPDSAMLTAKDAIHLDLVRLLQPIISAFRQRSENSKTNNPSREFLLYGKQSVSETP